MARPSHAFAFLTSPYAFPPHPQELLGCYSLIGRLGRGAVYFGSARLAQGSAYWERAVRLAERVRARGVPEGAEIRVEFRKPGVCGEGRGGADRSREGQEGIGAGGAAGGEGEGRGEGGGVDAERQSGRGEEGGQGRDRMCSADGMKDVTEVLGRGRCSGKGPAGTGRWGRAEA